MASKAFEIDNMPPPPAPAYGDSIGAMTIAGGISAALLHRERTGEATVVDVSLLGAAVWTLSVDLVPTSVLGVDPEPHSPGRSLATVLVGSYRTADGRWFSLKREEKLALFGWCPKMEPL